MKKARLGSVILLIPICFLLQACSGDEGSAGWSAEGLKVNISDGISLGSHIGTLRAGPFKRYLVVVGTFRCGSEPSFTSDEVYITTGKEDAEQEKIALTAVGLLDFYVVGPFTGNLTGTSAYGIPIMNRAEEGSREGSFSLTRLENGEGLGVFNIRLEQDPSELRLAFEIPYEFEGGGTLHLGGSVIKLPTPKKE